MLKIARAFIGKKLHTIRVRKALQQILETRIAYQNIADWSRSIESPTAYYLDCVRFFYDKEFPDRLKKHRSYFSTARRGFGEEAFHVMWWMLFEKFKPASFLEIGVYRGQTLSLAALLHQVLKIEGSCIGISPFNSTGDTVSQYDSSVDYLQDTIDNFQQFQLPAPELIRAFSTDESAKARIRHQTWDAIYIDGNHDYEIAKADWTVCSDSLRSGGFIVLDDASMNTDFSPPPFATTGHPGPSRVAMEIVTAKFPEVLKVGHNRVFQKI